MCWLRKKHRALPLRYEGELPGEQPWGGGQSLPTPPRAQGPQRALAPCPAPGGASHCDHNSPALCAGSLPAARVTAFGVSPVAAR